MMHVYVNRFIFGDDSTVSACHFNGQFQCFLLEDQVREGEKVYGETAISAGTYEAELRTEGGFHNRYINRFHGDPVIDHIGMIHLPGVPNFTYIQFHPGNTDEHTKGCPLTGTDLERRSDGVNNYNIAGGTATKGYRLFYPPVSKELAKGEEVLFHFKNADFL